MEDGSISLTFYGGGDRRHLKISDNGKGFEGDFKRENSETLSLRLIRTLAVNQLGGDLSVENNDRTKFFLIF